MDAGLLLKALILGIIEGLTGFLPISSTGHLIMHEIAVTVFLFITAPVTAHLLAKAALHRHTIENRKDVDGAEN